MIKLPYNMSEAGKFFYKELALTSDIRVDRPKTINLVGTEYSDLEADALTVPIFSAYYVGILRKLRLKLATKVLAHELVHVSQYETGRLQYTDDVTIWEGKEYVIHREKSLSYEEYKNQPWEEEAFRLEKVLYSKYLEQTNDYKTLQG